MKERHYAQSMRSVGDFRFWTAAELDKALGVTHSAENIEATLDAWDALQASDVRKTDPAPSGAAPRRVVPAPCTPQAPLHPARRASPRLPSHGGAVDGRN